MDIVSLLDEVAKGFEEISEDFYLHPENFSDTELRTVNLCLGIGAKFQVMLLEGLDELIRGCSLRNQRFVAQRKVNRTLVSSAGDVTFSRTKYYDKEQKRYRMLVDELMKIPKDERFTVPAEAQLLSEAEVHSYQHAADSLCIGAQKVTKTTVMNKVHSVEKEFTGNVAPALNRRKCLDYLYIDADEDHIHSQHKGQPKQCMLGKLIYIYEGKEDVCKGKRKLISPHYFGGLYAGSDENERLWTGVQKYIEDHYDPKYLKTVYINGDGGGWIKAGVAYVDKSVFVADRFHLSKYINAVSNLMLDEADDVKRRLYKKLYKGKKKKVKKLLDKIQKCSDRDTVVEATRTYILNNWDAIQRSLTDKNVMGCSAEGHVSNVYSDRLSSRPMAWCEDGCDGIMTLRNFVRNNGRDKIIDLVEYRRKKVLRTQEDVLKTGTDDIVEITKVKAKISAEQRRNQAYIEKIQATIPGMTVKKTLAIREQIRLL